MILTLNITKENLLYQVFSNIDKIICDLTGDKYRTGRPKLYTDTQIIKCLVYQALNRLVGFRELEWRLNCDPIAKALLKLDKSPDHSTFCLRAKQIEETIYDDVYQMAIVTLEPQTRICFWDSTALRSSRFDSEARSGRGTRLGWYKGYKLHTIVSEDRIPLTWKMTTANMYDNQVPQLIDNVIQLDIFMLLGDAAYDDTQLFSKAKEANIHLATDINIRNASSLDTIKDPMRQANIQYRNGGLGQKMMRKRIEIERLFSVLKVQYHLENPRLYGENRYTRHIMWVLFTYLCDRLVDKVNGIFTMKARWNR